MRRIGSEEREIQAESVQPVAIIPKYLGLGSQWEKLLKLYSASVPGCYFASGRRLRDKIIRKRVHAEGEMYIHV